MDQRSTMLKIDISVDEALAARLFQPTSRKYSRRSIVHQLNNFLQSVQRVSNTVLVPRRLSHVNPPDISQEQQRAVELALQIAPHRLFELLQNVQNHLRWGRHEGGDDLLDEESSDEDKEEKKDVEDDSEKQKEEGENLLDASNLVQEQSTQDGSAFDLNNLQEALQQLTNKFPLRCVLCRTINSMEAGNKPLLRRCAHCSKHMGKLKKQLLSSASSLARVSHHRRRKKHRHSKYGEQRDNEKEQLDLHLQDRLEFHSEQLVGILHQFADTAELIVKKYLNTLNTEPEK